ncbi:hypothetical protein ABEW34_01980 [Paenibacillus algorifonticola]|uniref:hypothetical protein n=1 Tax=Paenibacillus algorifonticola TaxID=684063 RepID=UPI003D274DB5
MKTHRTVAGHRHERRYSATILSGQMLVCSDMRAPYSPVSRSDADLPRRRFSFAFSKVDTHKKKIELPEGSPKSSDDFFSSYSIHI